MSRSPDKVDESTSRQKVDQYSQASRQLGRLIASGRSFSGRERHCAYLNTSDSSKPRFANISSVTGFDYEDDGRGMATTDWDFDGDLDFWISNRTGPRVRFLRNDVESSNRYLLIHLQGNGTTCNRDGIGARVEVVAGGQTLLRTQKAGDGFLSQSSKWLHFGLGAAEKIDVVRVRWPDGQQQTFSDVEPNRFYHIVQGDDELLIWNPPKRQLSFEPTVVTPRATSEKMRLVLHTESPLPRLTFSDLTGETRNVRQFLDEPLLLNIWASWCGPCLAEMKQFQEHDVHVLALSVDGINDGSPSTREDARQAVSTNGFQFAVGFANPQIIKLLEAYVNSMYNRHQPLPIPSSFLIKTDGTVNVVYKGPVETNQLSDDWEMLTDSAYDRVQRISPFQGRWLTKPGVFYRTDFASHLVEKGMLEEACDYVQQFFTADSVAPGRGVVIGQLIRQLRMHDKHDLADQLESNSSLHGHAPQF